MMARMMSLGSRPGPSRPVTSIPKECGRGPCQSAWVASTCSTSLVPIPKARAPNAPWVLVWLSPQTIVKPGRGQPQLGADHVHDPLAAALDVIERDAELATVRPHRLDLPARQRVADVELIVGRHVVIDGGERQVRPPHPPPRQPQPIEGLRARHLVHQVAVDIEQRPFVGRLDHVTIPDFFEQCLMHPPHEPRPDEEQGGC